MKCCACHRGIASGVEAKKMVVEYTQPDGSTKLFGYQMPDGELPAATGRILRGWHAKCFHVQRKREARGDAVTGRVLAGGPTGYDIHSMVLTRDDLVALGITAEQARAQGTAHLTERLNRLRAVARSIGKAVGDLTVLEAFWAEEKGGPYPHGHHLPMEMYQLAAHLRYAHGINGPITDSVRVHKELHAHMELSRRIDDRDADPGHQDPQESDWRTQLVATLDDLTTGGDP